MRALRTDRSAQTIIAGHAFMQNLRRGHYELGLDAPPELRVAARSPNSPPRSEPSGNTASPCHPTKQCNGPPGGPDRPVAGGPDRPVTGHRLIAMPIPSAKPVAVSVKLRSGATLPSAIRSKTRIAPGVSLNAAGLAST